MNITHRLVHMLPDDVWNEHICQYLSPTDFLLLFKTGDAHLVGLLGRLHPSFMRIFSVSNGHYGSKMIVSLLSRTRELAVHSHSYWTTTITCELTEECADRMKRLTTLKAGGVSLGHALTLVSSPACIRSNVIALTSSSSLPPPPRLLISNLTYLSIRSFETHDVHLLEHLPSLTSLITKPAHMYSESISAFAARLPRSLTLLDSIGTELLPPTLDDSSSSSSSSSSTPSWPPHLVDLTISWRHDAVEDSYDNWLCKPSFLPPSATKLCLFHSHFARERSVDIPPPNTAFKGSDLPQTLTWFKTDGRLDYDLPFPPSLTCLMMVHSPYDDYQLTGRPVRRVTVSPTTALPRGLRFMWPVPAGYDAGRPFGLTRQMLAMIAIGEENFRDDLYKWSKIFCESSPDDDLVQKAVDMFNDLATSTVRSIKDGSSKLELDENGRPTPESIAKHSLGVVTATKLTALLAAVSTGHIKDVSLNADLWGGPTNTEDEKLFAPVLRRLTKTVTRLTIEKSCRNSPGMIERIVRTSPHLRDITINSINRAYYSAVMNGLAVSQVRNPSCASMTFISSSCHLSDDVTAGGALRLDGVDEFCFICQSPSSFVLSGQQQQGDEEVNAEGTEPVDVCQLLVAVANTFPNLKMLRINSQEGGRIAPIADAHRLLDAMATLPSTLRNLYISFVELESLLTKAMLKDFGRNTLPNLKGLNFISADCEFSYISDVDDSSSSDSSSSSSFPEYERA